MKPELLAPAGSPEALTAALRCGADAVYVGVKSFSARSGAVNFTFEELRAGAELCHLYGARLYVALNTLVYDNEYTALAEAVKRSAEAGADAFIVQDIGVAALIREVVPQAKLHASTQMTLHTPMGAEYARGLGFSRVVAARELDKKSLAQLCGCGVEIEVFVHGALCMSVSGQCFMSAMIGGRSANRGFCAQACRLPASSGASGYALSLKDLSLAEHVEELAAMGVASLKIEGRMKRPEYVAAATTSLRAALDGGKPDMDTLRAVFSRSGFTDGYFTGKRGGNMFGTRTRDDVSAAKDKLPALARLYAKPRGCVALEIGCVDGELCASDGIHTARTKLQTADMPPMPREVALRSLSKLGGSVYYADKVIADDDIRMSVSALNAARREAIAQLDEMRVHENTPSYTVNEPFPHRIAPHSAGKPKLRVRLAAHQRLRDDNPLVEYWVVPLEDAESFPYPQKMIVLPPRFICDEKKLYTRLERLGGGRLMCTNAAYITMGERLGFALHGDFGLNILSTASLDAALRAGLCDAVLSPELTLGQISRLGGELPRGIIAYGRLPFMLTRCCPISSAGTPCADCTGYITDRTGRRLPVSCGDGCCEVLNSERLWLADKLAAVRGVDFLLLLADGNDDVAALVKAYSENFPMPEGCTRGLFFRGLSER